MRIIGCFRREAIGAVPVEGALQGLLSETVRGQAGPLVLAVHDGGCWERSAALHTDWRGVAVDAAGAARYPRLTCGLQVAYLGDRLRIRRGHLSRVGLFYYEAGGGLYFASQLRDLLCLLAEEGLEPDEGQVAAFLHLQSPHPRKTFYRRVRRLEAGGELVVEGGRLRRSWSPPAWTAMAGLDASAVREALGAAVAAIPGKSGYLLSGGIDSSALLALGQKAGRAGGAFHLIMRGNGTDTALTQQVAGHLGVRLETIAGEELDPLGSLEEEIDAFGEPHLVPNQFMMQAASRGALRNGLTHLVSGVDGDCTFSLGYELVAGHLRGGRLPRAWRQMRDLRALDGRSWSWHLKEWALKPLLGAGLRERLTGGPRARSWVDPDWLATQGWREATFARTREEQERWGGDLHQEGMFHSLNSHIFELSAALRGRGHVAWAFPYYAPEVVSLGLSLTPEQKFSGGHNRYLLRKAVEPLLPREVAWRRDKGYLGEGLTRSLLRYPDLRERWDSIEGELPGFIDRKGPERLLERLRTDPHPALAEELWPLLALGIWRRQLRQGTLFKP